MRQLDRDLCRTNVMAVMDNALQRCFAQTAAGAEPSGISRKLIETKTASAARKRPELLNQSLDIWEKLNAELGGDCPVQLAESLAGLAQANVILGSSNAPHAVIDKTVLGAHETLICDISVPPDVATNVRDLPNVSVIQGGVVRLPGNPDFQPACSPLRPGSRRRLP